MAYKEVLKLARNLRKNQTPAEKVFWNKVRGRKFIGLKFNRQFIIQHSEVLGKKSYFIPDFYCHEKKLIVEIDGRIHLKQIEYDELREDILIKMKYKIIRFKNEEVLTDWNEVEKRLTRFIESIK